MSANMSSCEAAFVARVEAMEFAMLSSATLPVNPILAAQKFVDNSCVRARPGRSPLRQESTLSMRLEAPLLKRNYGSLDLSRMVSPCSSSASSCLTTPTSGVFPIHRSESTGNECGDFIEQTISPPSSTPNSPALEFSTHQKAGWGDEEPFGIMFGLGLTPEFAPIDEVSAYLDFMDTLEDCDSLGRFASAVPSLHPDTLEITTSRLCSPTRTLRLESLGLWNPEHTTGSPLLNTDNFSSSPDIIELSCADLNSLDQLMNFPKPTFNFASPRIVQGSWGLESPILDSAAFSQVASPAIGSGSFEVMSWIPAIASLALVAGVMMGQGY